MTILWCLITGTRICYNANVKSAEINDLSVTISSIKLKMCVGKAQCFSPILDLLVPPGKYYGMITQLPVRNMISMPNFMAF